MERRGPGPVPVRMTVNGVTYELTVPPRRTLLDALREDLGLTGAKRVCDEGTCGACTVSLDGQAVYSCLVLAVECEGRTVETVEGLIRDGELHPVQEAFIEHDAAQCGFCTPGQIMALKALLDQNPRASLEDIRQTVAGNLCRCGAYPKIIAAGLTAAGVVAARAAAKAPEDGGAGA